MSCVRAAPTCCARDVRRRFGTREDLHDLVATAHPHGICVILRISFNHAGDVLAYDALVIKEFALSLGRANVDLIR
jgi:hypothetical protein